MPRRYYPYPAGIPGPQRPLHRRRHRPRRRLPPAADLLPLVAALRQARARQSLERRRPGMADPSPPPTTISTNEPVVTWEAYNYDETRRGPRGGPSCRIATARRADHHDAAQPRTAAPLRRPNSSSAKPPSSACGSSSPPKSCSSAACSPPTSSIAAGTSGTSPPPANPSTPHSAAPTPPSSSAAA